MKKNKNGLSCMNGKPTFACRQFYHLLLVLQIGFCLFVSCNRPIGYGRSLTITEALEFNMEQASLGTISDVTVDTLGRIILCDKRMSNAYALDKNGAILSRIGIREKMFGDLQHPSAVTVDRNNHIYIGGRFEVTVFAPNFQKTRRFETHVERPITILVTDDKRVCVVGYSPGGLIHKYDLSGKHQGSFGNIYPSDNLLIRRYYSGGYAIFYQDNIIVSYRSEYRIEKYSLDGKLIDDLVLPAASFVPQYLETERGASFKKTSYGHRIFMLNNELLNIYFHVFQNQFLMDRINPQDFSIIERNIHVPEYLLTVERDGTVYYVVGMRSESRLKKGNLKDDIQNRGVEDAL